MLKKYIQKNNAMDIQCGQVKTDAALLLKFHMQQTIHVTAIIRKKEQI